MAYFAKSAYQIQLAGIPGYSELFTMISALSQPREVSTFYDGKGEQITLLGIIKPGEGVTIEKPFDEDKDSTLIKFHKSGRYPAQGLVLSKTPKNTDGTLLFSQTTKLTGVWITDITIPDADLNQTAPEVGRLVVTLNTKAIIHGQS